MSRSSNVELSEISLKLDPAILPFEWDSFYGPPKAEEKALEEAVDFFINAIKSNSAELYQSLSGIVNGFSQKDNEHYKQINETLTINLHGIICRESISDLNQKILRNISSYYSSLKNLAELEHKKNQLGIDNSVDESDSTQKMLKFHFQDIWMIGKVLAYIKDSKCKLSRKYLEDFKKYLDQEFEEYKITIFGEHLCIAIQNMITPSPYNRKDDFN